MNVTHATMTVGEYCQAMERQEIRVNREYQRSDQIWPSIARSYLIESLILGFPLPKFTHYLVTDIKTKKTIREIVDGQQRSGAIADFYKDSLRLSLTLETEAIQGKIYSELDEDDQSKFLPSVISVDQIIAPDLHEVREAFRRMNSYTVPLNAEEHRHAVFQGPLKWFVQKMTGRYNSDFINIGLFAEKQIIRMADTKLFSEIIDALVAGIRTTNKTILNKLYKSRDKEFVEEAEFEERLTSALDTLLSFENLRNTSLMKPYIVYALLLALMHLRNSVDSLEAVFASPDLARFDREIAERNLLALSEALENPDENHEFKKFIVACTSKTNVRDQRETRFRWMCRALLGELV